MKLTGMLALAIATLSTGACKRTVEPDSIETTIEKLLADKGITVVATCPKGQEGKPGSTFNCTAVEGNNPPLEFKVDIQEGGKFYVGLVGSMIEASKVAENFAQTTPGAVVKCAWTSKAMKQGDTAICDVSGVEGMTKVKITLADSTQHMVTYEPLP